ncbi:unnamed protein product [Peniophora sp. CBMAI 1063]|nr:unnamed protein product [Peniophora sp. CBMAI 1063]
MLLHVISSSTSPPFPPPSLRQASFSHTSDEYGSTFEAVDEIEIEHPYPLLARQRSDKHRSLLQLPPLREPSPESEVQPRDSTPKPESELEDTEIMNDEPALWNFGPTTQDMDADPNILTFDDTYDIEVFDAPPILATLPFRTQPPLLPLRTRSI